MMSNGQFWAQLFNIPELAEIIYALLDPKSLHTLRLANKFFWRECTPHFSLTLDLDDDQYFPCLERMILSTIATKTDPKTPNPLLQIKTVKLTSGHFLYLYLAHILPQGMASVLNHSQSPQPAANQQAMTENTSRVAQLTDPDKQALSNLAHMRLFHPIWGEQCDSLNSSRPWNFWDLLFTEGTCFGGLETLVVETGSYSPRNLDLFMIRLGHSSAAKTLRSLAIVEPFGFSLGLTRTISLDAFRDGVCNLIALEALTLNQVSIGNHGASVTPTSHSSNIQVPEQRRAALKVMSLSLLSEQREHGQAIMDLFPNLELLTLNNLRNSQNFKVDRLNPPALTKPNGPGIMPTSFPFLRLKVLDVSVCDYEYDHFRESGLFQFWLSREHGVQVDTLNLLPDGQSSGPRQSAERMTAALNNNSAFVRHLRIDGTMDPDWTFRILDFALFGNLEGLEILDLGLDPVEMLKGDGFLISPQYQLDMASLFTKAPWKRTLTRLCIPSPVDDFLVEGVSTSALQLLPELIDFEIQMPIQDLDFFRRVGRCTPVAATMTAASEGPYLLENYYNTERPHLERLRLCQSNCLGHSSEPWREQLRIRFRFLSKLTLTTETDRDIDFWRKRFSGSCK